MRMILRLISLFLLAVAVVLAVVDLTTSIADSAWYMTPLSQSWEAIHGRSLSGLQSLIERNISPFLWDPVLTRLLALPGWIVFALLAMLFQWAGQKRRPDRDLLIGR